jgi:plastocyanin
VNRRAVIASCLVFAAVLAGCSKKNAVGTGVKVNGEASAGGLALGSTTTTVAVTSTTSKSSATTVKATTTTAQHTTTTAAAAPTLVIKIQNSNASDGAFSPAAGVTVPRGSVVRWQNTDSQPRSVIADDNSFASPMIPPGGTFDYTFNSPGKVSYHDGTRPFAVGSFTVQ